MTDPQGVILGLGLVSGLFAYYGLNFIESPEFFTKLVGELFFLVSTLFIFLIVNTIYLVILNDSTLSYLNTGLAYSMLYSFYVFMGIGCGIYIIYIFYKVYSLFKNAFKEAVGGRKKSGGE